MGIHCRVQTSVFCLYCLGAKICNNISIYRCLFAKTFFCVRVQFNFIILTSINCYTASSFTQYSTVNLQIKDIKDLPGNNRFALKKSLTEVFFHFEIYGSFSEHRAFPLYQSDSWILLRYFRRLRGYFLALLSSLGMLLGIYFQMLQASLSFKSKLISSRFIKQFVQIILQWLQSVFIFFTYKFINRHTIYAKGFRNIIYLFKFRWYIIMSTVLRHTCYVNSKYIFSTPVLQCHFMLKWSVASEEQTDDKK